MKISQLQLDDLNANLGTDRGRKMLAESLKQYGAGRSILVDKNNRVIAGNKTLTQALAAGHTDVIVVKTDGTKLVAVQRLDLDLKDARAQALAIADNRVAEIDLRWNPQILEQLGKQIGLEQFWSKDELAELMKGAGDADQIPEAKVDQAAELLKKWKTKAGQLWRVGPHRILCGDSTDQDQVARLLASPGRQPRRATMAFTDPPWNVAIGTGSRAKSRMRTGIKNDAMDAGKFQAFMGAFAANLAIAVSGDVYVVMGCGEWPTVSTALEQSGFTWASTVLWVKDSFVMSRRQYHGRYEPIWYGWPAKGKSTFSGAGRGVDDIWNCARPKRSAEHPTMKPPELVMKAIACSSKKGECVIDLFLGGGATMVAAEQTGRTCIGMDLDPAYVAVTLDRLAEMGLKPQLD